MTGTMQEIKEKINYWDRLIDEFCKTGNYVSAVEYCEKILQTLNGSNDIGCIAHYQEYYGELLCLSGKLEKGVDELDKAHKLMFKINGGIRDSNTCAIMMKLFKYSTHAEIEGIVLTPNKSDYLCGFIDELVDSDAMNVLDEITGKILYENCQSIIKLERMIPNYYTGKLTDQDKDALLNFSVAGLHRIDYDIKILCKILETKSDRKNIKVVSELFSKYVDIIYEILNKSSVDIISSRLLITLVHSTFNISIILEKFNMYKDGLVFLSTVISHIRDISVMLSEQRSLYGNALDCIKSDNHDEGFIYFLVENGGLWLTINVIYSHCIANVYGKEIGLSELKKCSEWITDSLEVNYNEEAEESRVNELASFYSALKCQIGIYYVDVLHNYEQGKTYLENAIYTNAPEYLNAFGKICTVTGDEERAKRVFKKIINEKYTEEKEGSVLYCREWLAERYRDKFNYTKAIKLYKALLESNKDPFDCVRYRNNMYHCMGFADVDTLEKLNELEIIYEKGTVFEIKTLDTIQTLNALAAGYISYGNHLIESGDIYIGKEYLKKGTDTYERFFDISDGILTEAIEGNKRKDIMHHMQEYDRAVQRYLELMDISNRYRMFDVLSKYQSFSFEVDRLLSGGAQGYFDKKNIAEQVRMSIGKYDKVFNYCLFYERDIRKYGLFVIDESKLSFYTLSTENETKEAVENFYNVLTNVNATDHDYDDAKKKLYECLLCDTENHNVMDESDDIHNIYIVRTHGLEKIPFHILMDKSTIELMNVSELLDDTLPLELNNVTMFASPEYEVYGYEVKDSKYENLEGSSLEIGIIEGLYGKRTSLYKGIDANVSNLKQALDISNDILHISTHHIKTHAEVNEASLEAGIIDDLYEKRVSLYKGIDDNVSNLKQVLNRSADILHISTHHIKMYGELNGYMDSTKLLMAGANNLAENEEFISKFGKGGMISAEEISKEHVSRRLVILAACNTSSGEIVEGSGGYGLSRAFYQHNCVVISSLYDIGDIPTAVFFKFFYESLQEYNDPNKSIIYAREKMRTAKKKDIIGILKGLKGLPETQIHRGNSINKHIRDIRMNAEKYPYSHPYYWAGFIIGGR